MQDVEGDASTERAGGAEPAAGTTESALYVINVCSSAVPMALELKGVAGLEGLVLFRSRQVADGRARYRLHLGYFEKWTDAERVLPRVHERHPGAWITLAPQSGLGSLDDTGSTEFRLIRAPARARALETGSTDEAAANTGTVNAATSLASGGTYGSMPQHATTLQAREPSAYPWTAYKAALSPAARPAAAPPEQRHAVQLLWTRERSDLANIPAIAIFEAFTLYTV